MRLKQLLTSNRVVRAGALLLLALLLWGGFELLNLGFAKVKSVWELERIPTAPMSALLPGEVIVEGEIADPLSNTETSATENSLLMSKLSRQQTVYFRYLHEQEVGSGDDKRWQTVELISQAVNFRITSGDDSLKVNIDDGKDRVAWSMPLSKSHQEGSHRFREWVLMPGDQVTVVGWLQRQAGQVEIGFNQSGQYQPIVSRYGLEYELRSLGHNGIFLLWGGLAILGFAVYGICYIFSIHRILAYLTILSLVYVVTLFALGVTTYQQDLQGLAHRWERQLAEVDEEMNEIAAQYQLTWAGLNTKNAFNQFQDLPEVSKRRVDGVKQNLERSSLLARYQLTQLPAKLLSKLWEIEHVLPAALQELPLTMAVANHTEARLAIPVWQWLVTIVSAFLGVVFTVTGLRAVKLKRWIENIPKTKVQGVVWGVNELNGQVTTLADSILQGPLSQQPCVWFDYRVFERSRNDNKTEWQQIERRTEGCLFLLTDDTGSVLVDPTLADVSTTHSQQARKGERRIQESSLRNHDHLYLLGSAECSDRDDYLLKIGKGKTDEPFILSCQSEQEVMLKKARKGMLLLNLASSAVMLSCLLLFTSTGIFSGLDFIATALIATGYLLVLVLILHYNDLVFLKHRVQRAMANIDVALQKRFDLVNSLLPVVKRYAAHEQSLLIELTKLRDPGPLLSAARGKSVANNRALSAWTAQSKIAAGRLSAVAENYPELRQHRLIAQFMAGLTRLENETSLMRDGYNDAVENYQTRLQSFPDLFIARLFRFKKAEFGLMD